LKKRLIFVSIFLIFSFIIFFNILYPVFVSDEIIINYGINPFDICQKNPKLWKYIKISYIISFIISNFIISNYIYSKIFSSKFIVNKKNQINKKNSNNNPNIKNKNTTNNNLNLLIGFDLKTNSNIYIPESGLYQNILITGTIGSGKTSSAMYPFTEQLIKYNYNNKNNKIGMLILDVKGNYFSQVKKYCKKYYLENDLLILGLNSNLKYNPLHKPNLKPQVLANRLKTILTLFSENNSESYWLDEAEKVLSEAIKLCRLYNNGYVNFIEIHNLITNYDYYKEKIMILKNMFISAKFNNQEIFDLNTAITFFEKEYFSLDLRTLSILKSEITRITNIFVSDYDIKKTFCPNFEDLNFYGFEEIINNGKILVLNMNISEYRNLSKIICAYLKLDFQTEILNNLSKNINKKTSFICDEYSEYVTKTDSEFFSLSREAKCINIISTQSYTSLKNALKDDSAVKVITQNLINKIWFRTDDILTIEEAQKQLGKEEKIKTSKSISENSKETNYNYFTNSFNSLNSNLTESYNTYTQNDFIYDTNFFTQNLETFSALTFLSDGNKILKPRKLKMFPYFISNQGGDN